MSDEARTVCVVTTGSYSDYHIVGVFSDEARANDYAHLIPDAIVEKWPLDPPFGFDAEVRAGLNLYEVLFIANPASYQQPWTARQRNPLDWDKPEPSDWNWSERTDHEGMHAGAMWGSICVWARDEDHAVKIAQDKRAEWLAQAAGVA